MVTYSARSKLIEDARALEEAGSFAILVEAIPPELGKIITERAGIPIIGIGGGPYTDGQVLVFHDVLGFFGGHVAKFVKQYANLNKVIKEGLQKYIDDVTSRAFPAPEHCYGMDPEVLKAIEAELK